MLQVIALIVAFCNLTTIQRWQNEAYTQISNRISNLTSPIIQAGHYKDEGHLRFFAYAVFEDQNQKYKEVVLNKQDFPSWLFTVRYDGKVRGELWHHGVHNKVSCNILQNDSILFHINTVGKYDLEIFAKVFIYALDFHGNGVLSYSVLDKGFEQPGIDKLNDLNLLIWAFPHPTHKGWTVVIMDIDISSPWPIAGGRSEEYLKWHVENLMLNIGERIK